MTEALRKYLMPVFAPEDGTGADGDVLEKDDARDNGTKEGGGSSEDTAALDLERVKISLESQSKLLDGDSENKGAGKADIPDNWRDLLTGGNEDIAKLINRYGSPANVGKALLEKEKIIRESGGKPKAVDRPGADADEKTWEEYRKAAGLPPDPTGYKLPDEVTKALTDADKPVLAEFTEFAHKKGMTPDGVAIAAEWYTVFQEKTAQIQDEADVKANEDCEDKLRSEWAGAEYKGNINLAQRFIEDKFGLPFKEFSDARLPDGRRLGSMPEFVMALSERGRETFGDAVFANTEAARRFDDRKAEIQKIMREDNDRYYSEKLDVEYFDILQKEATRQK